MPDLPDPELWSKLLHLTLATVVPTALLTFSLCWLLWGRRRSRVEERDDGGEFGNSESVRGVRAGSDAAAERVARLEEERVRHLRHIAEMERKLAVAESSRRLESPRETVPLQRVLDETRARLQVLQRERDAFAREVEALRAESARAEEDEERDEQETEDLGRVREELAEAREALRESEYRASRLGTEIQLLHTVRTEFEALRNDNSDLEDDLNALRAEKKALEDALEELRDQVEEAWENQRHAERERDTLQTALEVAMAASESPAPLLRDKAHAEGAFGLIYEEPPAHVDDLTRIEGVSSVLEGKLQDLGVYQYGQIAAWGSVQIEAFSQSLGFQDRIVRDRWVEHASRLAGEDEEAPAAPDDAPAVVPAPAADSSSMQELNLGLDWQPARAADPDRDPDPSELSAEDGESSEDEGDLRESEDEPPREVDEPNETADDDDAAGDPGGGTEEPAEAEEPEELPSVEVRDGDPRALDGEGSAFLNEDPELGPLYSRPPADPDGLTQIKGIGRVIEGRLHEIGIFRYRQIAAWTDAQVEAFSRRLSFGDRIERDRWREQARALDEEN